MRNGLYVYNKPRCASVVALAGYFPEVHTADIASAYPAIIRQLPDLRYSYLIYGENTLDDDIITIEKGTTVTITKGREQKYCIWGHFGLWDIGEEYIDEDTIKVFSHN
mgnify:CR=1 FL=1